MAETANIKPKELDIRNLLEVFISNQELILEGNQRIELRLEALEAQLNTPTKTKFKPKHEPIPLFTEKQLSEKHQIHRQTLYK